MNKIISNKLNEAYDLIGECAKLFDEPQIDSNLCKEDFYEVQDSISFLEENLGEEYNECCEICNGFAGVETSPEGQSCELCDKWFCNNCECPTLEREDDDLLNVCIECFDVFGKNDLEQKSSEELLEIRR